MSLNMIQKASKKLNPVDDFYYFPQEIGEDMVMLEEESSRHDMLSKQILSSMHLAWEPAKASWQRGDHWLWLFNMPAPDITPLQK